LRELSANGIIHAAVTPWQKMGAVGGGKARPAFLSTYPGDAERQQRLGALAGKMMPYYQAPGARPSHPVRIGPGAA
jgi:Zn-dependent protease with chaperone function